jgi:hypothetical protein
MKYKYRVTTGSTDTAGRYTKRPIVEVEISRGGPGRKFLALLDSGADQITMPAAIADALGIDRSACRPRSLMGITMQHIEGFVAQVVIRVQHHIEPITAPVVFIDTDVPVLLGQEAFFDRFRVKFEKDHDTFEIVPSPKS